jgi:polysaccharide deacetylase 2 family uncharacterized protein YibQ
MHRRRFIKHLMRLTGLCLAPGLVRPAAAMLPQGTGLPGFGCRMVLIIDDIGYSRRRAEEFAGLGVPLTFAVLPRLDKSCCLAESLHQRGFDILLHQPMEPLAPELNPGPGALFTGDSRDHITRVLTDNLAEMPFAIGVNNHMGSKFTSAPSEVHTTLAVLQSRDLLFVDSLTSSHSVAYGTARRMGMSSLCRNVFIDHRPDRHSVFHQLKRLENRAYRHGVAVGIGHPHIETLHGLRHYLENRSPDAPPITTVSALV